MDGGLLERLEAVLDDLAALDVDTLDDTTVITSSSPWVASRHGWKRPGAG
jgi:hypothetical protein